MALTAQRLYYEDSYLTKFQAVVMEQSARAGHWHVRLDRTAFYPTSGGQPHDTGTLGGARVLDVYVQDGDVWHVLASELKAGANVTGKIDWLRRFDHMQQHCGQHVLSACFEQLLDADTVGFHLGEETSTVDVAIATLDESAAEVIERRANEVIWENRVVRARFVDPDELATIPLRHPPKVERDIRIVTLDEFDDNACGGTHPARTGELGQLKIQRWERLRGGVRIQFVCGLRALTAHSRLTGVTTRLAERLLTSGADLEEAVDRLRANATVAHRLEGELRQRIAELLGAHYAGTAELGERGVRYVCAQTDIVDPGDLKSIANAVAARLGEPPYAIALVGTVNGRVHVYATCAGDTSVDAATVVKDALAVEGGKGGGTVTAAQGSAPATDDAVEQRLLGRLREQIAPL